MRVVILPTRIILNILTLCIYITDTSGIQISSPISFLLVAASRLSHPAELPFSSLCHTIT